MNKKYMYLAAALVGTILPTCPSAAEAVLEEPSGGGQTEAIEEYALDDIVVTATRTPVEAFKANANINVKIGRAHV